MRVQLFDENTEAPDVVADFPSWDGPLPEVNDVLGLAEDKFFQVERRDLILTGPRVVRVDLYGTWVVMDDDDEEDGD